MEHRGAVKVDFLIGYFLPCVFFCLPSLKQTYPLKMGVPWKRRFRTWKPSSLGANLLLVSGRVSILCFIGVLLTENINI